MLMPIVNSFSKKKQNDLANEVFLIVLMLAFMPASEPFDNGPSIVFVSPLGQDVGRCGQSSEHVAMSQSRFNRPLWLESMGAYNISFVDSFVNDVYVLSAQQRDDDVRNVKIVQGPASANESYAYGGVLDATMWLPCKPPAQGQFWPQARDRFGNNQTAADGDQFRVRIVGDPPAA
jgi:hypothetical protein